MPQRIDPYTTTELAQAAGVGDSYIRQLLIAGRLQGRKQGRDWAIPVDVAETFLLERKERGKK
jgi:excisionase family DNA binding protein